MKHTVRILLSMTLIVLTGNMAAQTSKSYPSAKSCTSATHVNNTQPFDSCAFMRHNLSVCIFKEPVGTSDYLIYSDGESGGPTACEWEAQATAPKERRFMFNEYMGALPLLDRKNGWTKLGLPVLIDGKDGAGWIPSAALLRVAIEPIDHRLINYHLFYTMANIPGKGDVYVAATNVMWEPYGDLFLGELCGRTIVFNRWIPGGYLLSKDSEGLGFADKKGKLAAIMGPQFIDDIEINLNPMTASDVSALYEHSVETPYTLIVFQSLGKLYMTSLPK